MFSLKFDRRNKNWTPDAEKNLMFLKRVQRECNDIFKEQRYLFLNDVYSKLGVRNTNEGAKYGWWYDDEIPFGINFVDFGLYDLTRKDARRFINGLTPDIVLYFNTYGEITSIMLDQTLQGIDRDSLFNQPWLLGNYI